MSHAVRRIEPGGIIGVLGGGQLGRMMTLAARQMGYGVHVYSPEADSPTGPVADQHWISSWSAVEPLRQFAQSVAVVTYEFENVPLDAARLVGEYAPVHPRVEALAVAQHRGREKDFLRQCGIPVAAYARVESSADLSAALAAVGPPGILKTSGGGYDGKGQCRVTNESEAESAWATLGHSPAVYERLVEFDAELSVIGARAANGHCVFYGPIANEHANHILDVSTLPAALPAQTAKEAVEITRTVLERLNVVGVLCVEFFLDTRGRLLVNEMAPRPHNSGHLTIDAHMTSQFEQQVRAVCGLPLGSAEQWRPAAMANLLGDLWTGGEPNWGGVLEMEDVKLHLYGKGEARPGRKMGHLTSFGSSAAEARQRVLAARERLTSSSSRTRH